jgi:hypothetical protein
LWCIDVCWKNYSCLFWYLKRGHVTNEWRKLHNEQLHNFYSSPNRPTIRPIKLRKTVGEIINAHTIFVKKPDGKKLVGKSRATWEDNIKIGYDAVDWIKLAKDGV